MHPTQLRRHFRALILTVFLSLGDAARAVPQMATSMSASLAVTQPGTSEPVPTAELGEVRPAPAAAYPRALYAGRDDEDVPRYVQRAFSDDERRLLREQFGIEEPARLYLSDTLPGASLIYDSDYDQGERRLVSSYRVGAPSVRRPGETWEALERSFAATSPESFPAATHHADRSLVSLDSTVRPAFERLLAAARQAGFRVRVTESRRSAERQAYLLTLDGHLTHTATSRHTDGFAVDVVVDTGDPESGHPEGLDRVPPLGAGHLERRVPPDRGSGPLLGLAAHRVRGWPARLPFGGGAARGRALVRRHGRRRLHVRQAPRGGIATPVPYFRHDAARSRAPPLSRGRSRRLAVRRHGPPGRPPVSTRRGRRGRSDAGGPDPTVAGPADE